MWDSADDLLRRIRLGEDSLLELKAVRLSGARLVGPRRDELADELAALANTAGGVIVLGVDDRTHAVEGVPGGQLDALETVVRDACNDAVEPPLQVLLRRVELPDEAGQPCALLRIDVPRSLFVHRSPGGYLQRLGSSKRVMKTEVLARLLQQRSQARLVRFDEQAVPATSLADLAPRLWQRFTDPAVEEPQVTLRKLRLLVDDSDGAERVSVAGALMASENPERWLPGASLQAVCYRGVERDGDQQLDARTLVGPLDRQILDALAFVRRNMRVAATKRPARVDLPQYDTRAVFEALVNAVAHRDYSIHGSRIRLFMFADRLELYSPGGLPNSLTIDSMALRQSTRNELIATLLGRCPVDDPHLTRRAVFLEKRGEGVPIILRETRLLSGQEPVYEEIDGAELRLTLPAATPPAPLE